MQHDTQGDTPKLPVYSSRDLGDPHRKPFRHQDMLDVLVYGYKGRNLSYREPEPHGHEVFVGWKLALHYEISRCVQDLVDMVDSRRASTKDRVFKNIFHNQRLTSGVRETRARTVRMLLMFDALFLQDELGSQGDKSETQDGWQSSLRNECKALLRVSDLQGTIQRLCSSFVKLEDHGSWKIPVPTLIAIAICYSQSQLDAPIVWEAFSAAHAREELERCWKHTREGHNGWKENVDKCIQFIGLLIRYQHAVGQFVRQSGDGRFINDVRGFVDLEELIENKDDLTENKDVVFDALRLMEIIGEVRSHSLPGAAEPGATEKYRIPATRFDDGEYESANADKDLDLNESTMYRWDGEGSSYWYLIEPAHIDSFDDDEKEALNGIVGSVFRDWDSFAQKYGEKIKPRGLKDLREMARRTPERFVDEALKVGKRDFLPHGYTWSFYGALRLPYEDQRDFRTLVEGIVEKDGTKDVVSFSLNRGLVRDIPEVFIECINEILGSNREQQETVFLRLFKHPSFRVPSWPSTTQGDSDKIAVEVQLRPEIAAFALLFRDQDIRTEKIKEFGREDQPNCNAAELLSRLFDKAKDHFDLSDGHGSDAVKAASVYLPYPLFDHLLETVARLKKEECVSVSIRFDDSIPSRIYFPADMGKHTELADYVANYVYATILNRAMTQGYQSCDISYAGLDTKKYPKAMEEWQKRLEGTYKDNAYRQLADKYVRNFNTYRKAVEVRPNSGWTTKEIFANEVLNTYGWRCWEHARKEQERHSNGDQCNTKAILLGVDIGGTLVKLQFYEFCENEKKASDKTVGKQEHFRLKPLDETLRISTPVPESEKEAGESLSRDERAQRVKKMARKFSEMLVDRITRVVQNDATLYRAFRTSGTRLVCAGVAWPGAVRESRIVGTSGILENFPPLTRDADQSRIEDLLEFDISGELEKALGESPLLGNPTNENENPTVAMVNDGIAEGYGGVADYQDENVAFIKQGTGLALAVFTEGQSEEGIWEGGKMILDLGAKQDHKYPRGDASSMLSRRFMPEFAKAILKERRGDKTEDKDESKDADKDKGVDTTKFDVSNLDSQEIGEFLPEFPNLSPQLVREFGLRDLARHKKVDVEILRRVLEKEGEAEPDLLNQVARLIDIAGTDGLEQFKKIVKERGVTKLSETLREKAQVLKNMVDGIYVESGTESVEGFRRIIARPAAKALGRRLGDFIVMVFNERRTSSEEQLSLMLAGGVLSGETGKLVKDVAKHRLWKYGLGVENQGELWVVSLNGEEQHKPSDNQGQSACGVGQIGSKAEQEVEPKRNTGTYGAARFALRCHLRERRQEGISKLRNRVGAMEANQTLTVENKRVCFSADDSSPIQLAEYGLEEQDAKEFLSDRHRELQIYLASGEDNRTTYRRWPS